MTTTRSATVADRYELLRHIGETRSGQVWEALDRRLDRVVEVRLAARQDVPAQQQLRALLRQARLGDQPDAPRVLDGGEDAEHGSFLVAELNERNAATRPFAPLVARPPGAKPRSDPKLGVLALVLVGLAILAVVIVVARAAFAPVELPNIAPTAEPPTRPLSGARTGEPTAAPTSVPTLAPARPAAQPQPPAQPTAAPTNVPTPQPTKAPTNAPTPQPTTSAQAVGSPVDTIRQHYALIDARNYAAGYQLMDSHLQSLNTPSDYAGWFANKVSIKPVSIDPVSQTGDEAVVRSVVDSTDRVNGQDITTRVSEQFVLHNENGAWRIDQVSRLS